jgi:hypothetical protein
MNGKAPMLHLRTIRCYYADPSGAAPEGQGQGQGRGQGQGQSQGQVQGQGKGKGNSFLKTVGAVLSAVANGAAKAVVGGSLDGNAGRFSWNGSGTGVGNDGTYGNTVTPGSSSAGAGPASSGANGSSGAQRQIIPGQGNVNGTIGGSRGSLDEGPNKPDSWGGWLWKGVKWVASKGGSAVVRGGGVIAGVLIPSPMGTLDIPPKDPLPGQTIIVEPNWGLIDNAYDKIFDDLLGRNPGPLDYYVYSLTAKSDGWYNCVECVPGLNPANPFGKEIYLKKGEIWKYGKAIITRPRYKNGSYEHNNFDLNRITPLLSEATALAVEKVYILNYRYLPENTMRPTLNIKSRIILVKPPGNFKYY